MKSFLRETSSSVKITMPKLCLCLLVLFFIANYSSFAAEFKLTPTSINFFGVVSSGSNIIAYGDYGAYMMTTDRGLSWKQYSVNESGGIRSMVNDNGTLWGILDIGYIIQSEDSGRTWKKVKVELESNDKLVRIIAGNDFLYARSLHSIFRFDKNVNFLNKFTDSILKVTATPPGIYPQEWPVDYAYYPYFGLHNGKLIAAANDSIFTLITLSEDLSNLEKKSFKINSKLPGYQKLGNISIYKGELVYHISGHLYKADANYENWTYFFKDTSFLSPYNKKTYDEWAGFGQTCYFYKDTLYYDKFELNNEKRATDGRGNNFVSLYNFQLEKYESNPTDSFIKVNNPFLNNYYSTRLKYGAYDGLTTALVNKSFVFEDSIIIRAGNYKTLLQTRNQGRTWELVSHLKGRPRQIINDSTIIFYNDLPNMNDVCRSEDRGCTFLPLTIPDSINWLPAYSNLTLEGNNTLFYLDSTSNGILGGGKFLTDNLNNLAYTCDGGKSYRFRTVSGLYLGDFDFPVFISNVNKINGTYLFGKTVINGSNQDSYRNLISLLDTSLNRCDLIRVDSLFIIRYILADNLLKYNLFVTVRDKNDAGKKWFEVRETNDSGKTCQTRVKLDHDLKITQMYEHNADSLFIAATNPCRVYLFDRTRNRLDTLYKASTSDTVSVMVLGGEFYLLGNNAFLKNADRNDLSSWVNENWKYGSPSFKSVVFKGNTAVAKMQDDVHQLNYYVMQVSEPISVHEDFNSETRYFTNHFYASEPYPNPAKNTIQAKIYWDNTFDIVDAIEGVFDAAGEKVEGRNNISLDYLGVTTATLTWNCKSVKSGVYFIVIKHHGVSDCIRVIVNR